MLLSSPFQLQYSPKRIISVVPSQTELLHYLGLDKEVLGITKFCIHPEAWFTTKPKIGGTKNINIELVNDLKADLIIANKEENEKEQIEELAKNNPVWVTNVRDLDSALQMIKDVGNLTKKIDEAQKLVNEIDERFKQLSLTNPAIPAVYLIWKNPYMTIGGDTFINDMMKRCGLINIYADQNRYPIITIEELQKNNCKLILLSSEPYPFKQKHIDELSNILPGCKIVLVNGEYFSWYGSKLLHAPTYFKELQQLITDDRHRATVVGDQ